MKARKIMKIIVFIVIAAILLGLGRMLHIRENRNDYIIDGPGMINTMEGDLTGVKYYSGGGMDGGYESYSLTLQPEDMTVLFEYEVQKYNGSDIVSGSKVLEWTAFEAIWDLCRNTSCLLLRDIDSKPSELQLLDAPTDRVIFLMTGEYEIVFRSDYDYPERYNGVISTVYSHMNQFLPQE